MSTGTLERPETAPDSPEEFTQEVVFEMLSNRRRRYVVHYLLDADGEAELRDLSRTVAAWENDKRPEEVTSTERKRVYNALQQAHLPKMDDAGLVEFDSSRSTVAATDGLVDLQVYLEIVPGGEISWSQYYLLLGLLFSSVALAAAVGVSPFEEVPGVALAGAMAVLLTLSGAAHVYHGRKTRLGADDHPPSV
ncbi:DUF7344 domain-containing protein [Halorussus ruber]|uniref:DUF7344 domain-containing protein n=1 Tax=Halorussus ruber TaxID=1126238 RepID=UPI001092E7AE|nr:hypothetical protein [Halorussus ruber]